MPDLDTAIRSAVGEFCNDMCAVSGAAVVLAVLDLHKPSTAPGAMTHYLREIDAYDKEGNALGFIVQVNGDPIPGYMCRPCGGPAPCPTVRAIAEKLGIEVASD